MTTVTAVPVVTESQITTTEQRKEAEAVALKFLQSNHVADMAMIEKNFDAITDTMARHGFNVMDENDYFDAYEIAKTEGRIEMKPLAAVNRIRKSIDTALAEVPLVAATAWKTATPTIDPDIAIDRFLESSAGSQVVDSRANRDMFKQMISKGLQPEAALTSLTQHSLIQLKQPVVPPAPVVPAPEPPPDPLAYITPSWINSMSASALREAIKDKSVKQRVDLVLQGGGVAAGVVTYSDPDDTPHEWADDTDAFARQNRLENQKNQGRRYDASGRALSPQQSLLETKLAEFQNAKPDETVYRNGRVARGEVLRRSDNLSPEILAIKNGPIDILKVADRNGLNGATVAEMKAASPKQIQNLLKRQNAERKARGY